MQKTISQQGNRYEFDVVVIGSGLASLTYLLELTRRKPQLKIALLTKASLTESNTFCAQGGIAAAVDQEDVGKHIADTLHAGGGMCNRLAVEEIIELGADSIEFLLSAGVPFTRDEAQNNLARGREAGHSQRRILHVGDETGRAITQALLAKIIRLPQITIYEYFTAINLITQTSYHQPQQFPEVIGVYALEEKTERIHTFLSRVIVLATGGAGKVYRYTSNPNTATGDGVAMAYRAGARLGGLEFYQFHPTLFYHPKINNFLISEALRGEGAYLRLPATGERFMQRYSPQHMELSTRDVVARAIFCEIEKQSNEDFVYLDVRHLSPAFIMQRFPMIDGTLKNSGINMTNDLIPVVPAAHYMGGGVLSNVAGVTDLKRLYAIGETAFTGFHGANRLASNSLLEAVVMGRKAAEKSCGDIEKPLHLERDVPDWDSSSVFDLRRASQINVHWRGLRGEMSSYAGIIRTEAGLKDQLKLVCARREMIEQYYWKYAITRDLIELRNIILVAELIVRAALRRRTSCGGHYREDDNQENKITTGTVIKLKRSDNHHIVADDYHEIHEIDLRRMEINEY